MNRPVTLTILGLACALALAGCGKKPKHVDSPRPEGEVDPFPRAYPNPSLDPKPGQPAPGVRFP
ncbi:hypothetical protein [Azospirillum agricola]|uniref:hypothetical protein n=1 Tax=Azospirillum agricola TaxID=1720247 RepID=UPI000A0F30BD|nr:hypothetical protein [Azospirillum agricola]SMH36589.1 hypothetical protein SAMN02982994_1062 [Azospirillum lipoferum]